MKIKGDGFRYFIDEKEVLYKDLQTKLRLDMTVEIEGLNVYYSSPKKEIKTATQQIKEKQEKVYINKLTVNVFNGDIKPVTFYNSFNTIKEVKEYLSSITYTSYTIFNGAKKIAYGTNHKQINMNRLVEEEIERQQKEFEVTNGSNRKGVLQEENIDVDWMGLISDSIKRGNIFEYKPSGTIGIEEITDIMKGKKENDGKTDYSEIDFDILDLMANRFNSNKHKYPHGNMLKPIEEKQLLFALLRHLKKMIQPVDNDPETFEEHLASILCNAQMVYQQRKLNKNLDIKK